MLLIYYIIRGIKIQGTSFWIDSNKIFVLIWITTLCLYDFKFSFLYNPTIEINIIVIVMSSVFVIASKSRSIKKDDIIKLFEGLKDKNKYKKYSRISNVIFAFGSITFLLNVAIFGLAIFSKNKINKQGMNHYSAYIVYMLVLCGQIKYILLRKFKKKSDLAVLIATVFILFLTLNRGPLVFIIVTVYIYEIANLICAKSSLTKKKIYLTLGIMVLGGFIFLFVFSYVGNMRMSYALGSVLHETLQEHYGMSKYVPKVFVWLYIYATSPLENVAYSIAHQDMQFTYFNNLLYPFIKFFANIVGYGDVYKNWLMSRVTFTPYLDSKVGLNVSSFIFDALKDFSYIGIVLYVGIYFALTYYSISLINRRKTFSSIGTLIIYSNVFIILILSIFENSLKVPVPLLNLILIFLVELNWEYGYLSKFFIFIKNRVKL